jgi:succinate dehydrogenase / fumarate reductase cytochrome b subunit
MKAASVITKVLMALTGLAWLGFLVMHLTGNFLLFQGAEKFNAYSDMLHSLGPLVLVADLGLILFLGVHVASALGVTTRNRRAREGGYSVRATNGQATWASRSMAVGGIILLTFIILHVKTFKFGDQSGEGGLHGLVVSTFKNPVWAGWYVLAMIALGLHLSHGFGSAFQTIGVFKPSWRARLKQAGAAFGWLIAAGFISMPLWAYFVAR